MVKKLAIGLFVMAALCAWAFALYRTAQDRPVIDKVF